MVTRRIPATTATVLVVSAMVVLFASFVCIGALALFVE